MRSVEHNGDEELTLLELVLRLHGEHESRRNSRCLRNGGPRK